MCSYLLRVLVFLSLSLASFAENIPSAQPPAEFKKDIFIPVVFYTPETSGAAGAVWIHNLWQESEGRTSSYQLTGYYTVLQQSSVSISPKLYFNNSDNELSGNISYSFYPNKFYSYGINQTTDSFESYTDNNFLSSCAGSQRLLGPLFFKIAAAYDERKITKTDPGGRVANLVQQGFGNLATTGITYEFDIDDRDYPQAPLSGTNHRIFFTDYFATDRDGLAKTKRFSKAEVDLRNYFSVGEKQTLSTQILFSQVWGGSEVPFQYMNSIGGSNKMRGYLAGRFRDLGLSLAQVDYHFDWKDKFAWSVFAGQAWLADHLAHLRDSPGISSAGIGFHYLADPKNRTKFRLDLGVSQYGPGFYLVIGEAI